MQHPAFLEEAARLFEERYPGTTVIIETFSAMPDIRSSGAGGARDRASSAVTMISAMDDPQGRADYINRVSTTLMSGAGADIYAMDVLPIHRFAAAGQLENLALYMDADPGFNRADYRGNIIDAVEFMGGTWFLPMDYSFEFYAFDSTLITGAAASGFGTSSAFSSVQLMDIGRPLFDGSAMLFNTPAHLHGRMGGAGMFSQLLAEQYTTFVDIAGRSARFIENDFAGLLELVIDYADAGYLPPALNLGEMMETRQQQMPQGGSGIQGGQGAQGGQTRPSGGMASGGQQAGQQSQQAASDRFFFKSNNSFSLMQQFQQSTGRRINMISIGGTPANSEDDLIAGIRTDRDGNVPFTFTQAYGINADSPNKETAWAFIRFMLSEEMQNSSNMSMMGFPLHNRAREQRGEALFAGAFMRRQGEPELLDDEQREAFRQYLVALDELSSQINSFTFRDTIVNDMITAEVAYFFDGSKTAAEVARALQNRVDLYLSE
jgi:multiple sugar transport system substrate-binding protein